MADAGAGGFGHATIGGETAGADDFYTRVQRLEGDDGGRAIHDGHVHIRDDHGNFLALSGVKGNRLGTVGGRQNPVAVAFENFLNDGANDLFIIHKQNQFVVAER